VANEYATIAARGSGNPSIYPLHAHLKNPASEKEFGDAWEEAAKDSSRLGWNTHDQRHREILQSKGFDGAILGDSVVVFNPKQLKSAIGNRGTYNTKDPNITKAKGGRASPFKNTKAPYVVYHGTNRNFNTFDPNAESNTQGGEQLRGTGAHFFTPDTELANAYTGASKSQTTGKYHAWPPESVHGGNVMPVHLNMVNPLEIDAEGKMYHQVEHHVKHAKKKGHDSVILRNVVDQPGAAGSLQTYKHDAHIVFSPKQIKSAIGNRGTYDINDPDITKKNGGITHAHHLQIEERPL
jgi:hypothetical protein